MLNELKKQLDELVATRSIDLSYLIGLTNQADKQRAEGRVLKEKKINDLALDIDKEMGLLLDENSGFGQNKQKNMKPTLGKKKH
jgi:hypothetical protein